MLLDELFAERERAQAPPTPPAPAPTPVPVLSVDPVAVPQTIETGRRGMRQQLAELESAARRNYRSAEEARRVLADEHQRLEQELNARTHAQHEAAALRREVERLGAEEERRAAQERTRAEREARAQIASELKRFQQEHDRVVQELNALRGSMHDHDGLLDEYATRLREEQGARAALRLEVERAEAARSLAERTLDRATENARAGAEDEMIRLATSEQQLADARSDRDRLASQLAELTAGDGAIGRLQSQIEERDAEVTRLGVRIADLGARIDASEEAARTALAERDEALAARNGAEALALDAERARSDAELAADVATTRIAELEAELAETVDATDGRSREIDKTLGKLRREARDASNARRTAESELATAEAERDELRVRVADLEAESSRARADGDRLRAHARASDAVLQAAAPAPSPATLEPEAPVEVLEEPPPPLPLRVAGKHAPAPQLVRRRPRRDDSLSRTDASRAVPQDAPAAVRAAAALHIPPDIPRVEVPVEAPGPVAVEVPVAAEVAPVDAAVDEVEPVAETPAPDPASSNGDAHRRTALAAFNSLAASNGEDFSFRRR